MLCNLNGLHGSPTTNIREVLGIILYILAQNESIKSTCKKFQHSSETNSRYFNNGLNALLRPLTLIMKIANPKFKETPKEIVNNCRYIQYFKL